MLSGVMTTAVLFALVTNELVDRQIAINRGQRRMRVRNHVVVCGLGVVGYRVARALRSRGLSVVVVERDPDGRFVGQARADGMAVVIGDATQEKALDFANLQEARSLVAVTNQDYRNLEIALLARSYSQELPVVLRLFDPSKQRRVAGLFCLETTFSSAALAAARFAASAAVPTRIARCAFGESVYDLHRVEVKAGENGVTAAAGINSVPICYEDGDGELHFGGFDQAPVGALVYAIKRQ
jgi:Trk K+ transport system NAD-binding subunit